MLVWPLRIDPLIAEAKRRARRRRFVSVLALLLVVAVGVAWAFHPMGGPGAALPQAAASTPQPVLALGSRGPIVAAWQRVLKSWLTPPITDPVRRAAQVRVGAIKVTGRFDEATEIATRYWQRDAYERVTGVVTLRTWQTWMGASVTCCGAGYPDFTSLALHRIGVWPSGPVAWWQHALDLWRTGQRLSPIVLDGVYNAQTRSATREFQRSVGLAPTGIANAATWRRASRLNVLHIP